MIPESYAKFVVLAHSGREALADTLGDIVGVDIVETLQDLLKEEYRQRDVYESYRYLLFGASGIGVKEHLEEHMAEEMGHVDLLQRYIVSLGKVPTTERMPIPVPQEYNLRSLMAMNLELERTAVEKYSIVISGLENLGNRNHVALINDLQTIVSQEQEHVHDLERWTKEVL
jgi:bacterioferritin (cytochrome b1)